MRGGAGGGDCLVRLSEGRAALPLRAAARGRTERQAGLGAARATATLCLAARRHRRSGRLWLWLEQRRRWVSRRDLMISWLGGGSCSRFGGCLGLDWIGLGRGRVPFDLAGPVPGLRCSGVCARVFFTDRLVETAGHRFRFTDAVCPVTGKNWTKLNSNLNCTVQTVLTG